MKEKSFWKKQLDNQFKYLNKMFDANDTSDRYQKMLCSAIGQLLYFKSKVDEKPGDALEKKQYEWLLNHRKKEKPIGNVYYPTTADEMNEGCDFFKLWNNAPTETNRSDLKTFFRPAYIREVERLKKENPWVPKKGELRWFYGINHNPPAPCCDHTSEERMVGPLFPTKELAEAHGASLKKPLDVKKYLAEMDKDFISKAIKFGLLPPSWEQEDGSTLKKENTDHNNLYFLMYPNRRQNPIPMGLSMLLKGAVDEGQTIVDENGDFITLSDGVYFWNNNSISGGWEQAVRDYISKSSGWKIKKGLNN